MPIHPRTLDALAKKGLTVGEDRRTGREVQLGAFEIQMVAGAGPGHTNHQSWMFLVEKLKSSGEEPDEYILAAKRVIEKKSGKEFVLVTYVIGGTFYDGTPLTESWREYGVWHSPVFKRVFNGRINRWEESDEVISSTPVHFIEFKGAKTKIESPITGKMTPIEELFREDTKFHVIADNGTKLKVSKEDWLQLGRADLLKRYDTPATNKALEDLTRAIAQAQSVVGKQ